MLLREEPDTAGLEEIIRQAAQAAAWSATASQGFKNAQALSRGWRSTKGKSYRLRSIRLPAGSLSAHETVLVLVERVAPAVPESVELVRRFGLSPREAQVARLLAYGRSDREIASELRLSRHTVRHHAEAVFAKIGIRSRKALAVHLASPPIGA
jgi:DNA-binding CsgD family transcriptional regulator